MPLRKEHELNEFPDLMQEPDNTPWSQHPGTDEPRLLLVSNTPSHHILVKYKSSYIKEGGGGGKKAF